MNGDLLTSVDAVLFDLDGTLIDTAPCIAAALNQALADNGLGSVESSVVTTIIGGGVPTLIERALTRLAVPHEPRRMASILASYRSVYLAQPGPTPEPFPGIERALAELDRMGLRLGIVTNTFDRFVHTLLQRTGLAHRFDIVVSADTIPERKPHPAPLLYACDALSATPAQTLFVGDSKNDSEAAQAAHIRMVCITYGYNEGSPVAGLACVAFLDDMGELPALINAWRQTETTDADRAA